ncbi:stalk domain-containing protein [Marinisporobacter balticus]|uniref:N-acetylmuramoyl-L-alanine amidase n=1 Tax=Marinisporobacter balticus TaxID=2018667 RepID=A0A4R2L340_9FIRM|nr:stalk domain-containing protein [Marinisporobacter balticus]TCO80092.1 N-acetylmuramoyl-L-alanine amidase [Marinisporobacter balticus]
MKKLLSIILSLGILFSPTSVHANSYVMHTVQLGDTYSKISEKYNKDLYELKIINEELGEELYAGKLMKISPVALEKNITIKIDEKNIPTDEVPYLENSRTFVPIRFIAESLNIEEILWDETTQTAILKNDMQTISLPIGSQTATINENPIKLDAPISIYKGRTFVPIRFIAEAFNCAVTWDTTNYIVDIHTRKSQNYTAEDIYWLSRIIHAESSAEPFEGKLAVGNVIINRKNSPTFPNTIKEVIFDQAYGYQFTPVLNKAIYNTPSTKSIEAALQALNGNNNIGGCLYFLNPFLSDNFWIVDNRTIYKSIKNHDFYL